MYPSEQAHTILGEELAKYVPSDLSSLPNALDEPRKLFSTGNLAIKVQERPVQLTHPEERGLPFQKYQVLIQPSEDLQFVLFKKSIIGANILLDPLPALEDFRQDGEVELSIRGKEALFELVLSVKYDDSQIQKTLNEEPKNEFGQQDNFLELAESLFVRSKPFESHKSLEVFHFTQAEPVFCSAISIIPEEDFKILFEEIEIAHFYPVNQDSNTKSGRSLFEEVTTLPGSEIILTQHQSIEPIIVDSLLEFNQKSCFLSDEPAEEKQIQESPKKQEIGLDELFGSAVYYPQAQMNIEREESNSADEENEQNQESLLDERVENEKTDLSQEFPQIENYQDNSNPNETQTPKMDEEELPNTLTQSPPQSCPPLAPLHQQVYNHNSVLTCQDLEKVNFIRTMDTPPRPGHRLANGAKGHKYRKYETNSAQKRRAQEECCICFSRLWFRISASWRRCLCWALHLSA